MTRPRILTIVIASSILIVAAAITIIVIRPFSNATRHPALLGATWGMSRAEVEKALGLSLSNDLPEPYFDILDRPIARHDRFSSFGISTSKFRLWNYETTVYFNFFDNKLYEYVVQLTSVDSASLDSTIVSQLSSKYGHTEDSLKAKSSANDFLHEGQWNSDLVRADYWMVKEKPTQFDPSAANPYNPTVPFNPDEYFRRKGVNCFVARVRVTYLPIEREINKIATEEKKKIF